MNCRALWLAVLQRTMLDTVTELTEKQMKLIRLGQRVSVYKTYREIMAIEDARNYFVNCKDDVRRVCEMGLVDYEYAIGKYAEKLAFHDRHVQLKMKTVHTPTPKKNTKGKNKSIDPHELADGLVDRMWKKHRCRVIRMKEKIAA